MKCPNCNVNLIITDRSNIEIDYCPDCRGIWLDRGELDKIIDRSSQTGQVIHSKGYANAPIDNRDDYYRRKKKGSFLSDLFDF